MLNSGGGAIDVDTGQALTLSGQIAGTGNLSKTGDGILVMAGANTYAGTTTVDSGVLLIQNLQALGSTSGQTVVSSNGTLRLQDDITIGGEPLTLNGSGASGSTGALHSSSGANTWTGDVTLATSSTVGVDNGTRSLSGVVDGPGSLIKKGTGTLVISGNNTYSGGTNVEVGTIQVSSAVHLGSGTLLLDGGVVNSTATFTDNRAVTENSSGGTLDVDAATTWTLSGLVSGSGGLTKTGLGTLVLTGGNSYSGGTTVSEGILPGDANGLQGNISNSASVVFDTAGAGTYAAVVSGTGNLVKTGPAPLSLSGDNTYTGTTTIHGGALRVEGSDERIVDQSDVAVNTPGVFDLNNFTKRLTFCPATAR